MTQASHKQTSNPAAICHLRATGEAAHLGIVALCAQGQHLIKALASGHEPAKAPEGAATKIAPADAFKLPISLDLEHADSGANVDKQIREQVFVGCSQLNTSRVWP